MTYAFEKIWIDQCDAAEGLAEHFGPEKALGYLIGEKFLNFIAASDTHPEFARELPAFVSRIKGMFEPHHLRSYLGTVRRVGSSGHIMSDEQYEEFRHADAHDTMEWAAKQAILLERAKALLLD